MDDINRYIDDISIGNDKQTFQTIFGHAITGEVYSQKIIIMHNPDGAASKSTLMNILASVLGDFYKCGERSLAFRNKGSSRNEGGHTEYLTELEERRLVTFCESSSSAIVDDYLNEAFFKMSSGEDKITGRGIFEKSKTLRLWFIAFIIVNKLPNISNDQAVWRRIVVLLMKARFVDNPNPDNIYEKKRDHVFINRLKSEENKSALLNWLIEGAFNFYKNGFPNTPDIKEYQIRYQLNNDSVLNFVYDQCIISNDRTFCFEECKDLWERFKIWRKSSSIFCEDKRIIDSLRTFNSLLENKELVQISSNDEDDDILEHNKTSKNEIVKIVKSKSPLHRRTMFYGIKLKQLNLITTSTPL